MAATAIVSNKLHKLVGRKEHSVGLPLVLTLAFFLSACGGSSGGGGGGSGVVDQSADMSTNGEFRFSTVPTSSFAQIDRMGVPVVASVVIRNIEIDGENQRDRFNEGDPADDGDFATDIVPIVDRLHRELDDDFCALGFIPCSRRDSASGEASSVCAVPGGDNFSITNCAVQAVPQIVPDVLTYDLTLPDGFPNGRTLEDPVVDRVLAVALLDINEEGDCRGTACNGDSIANIPLNPPANESPFSPDFPFLAPPHAVERE